MKSGQFWVNFGQFDPLRAIQAKRRLHSRYMTLWRLICCEKKKSYQTVFEKIGTLCKIGQFRHKNGRQTAKNDSIKNPKKSSRDIDPYILLAKFEKKLSGRF